MADITSFRGKYSFLSNFHPSPIKFDGIVYATAEHLYQSFKVKDKAAKQKIADLKSAPEAKRAGKKVKLYDGWDNDRLLVMEFVLYLKFKQNPKLWDGLFATGLSNIRHVNDHGDRFFGECDGTGFNNLGELLMKLRGESMEDTYLYRNREIITSFAKLLSKTVKNSKVYLSGQALWMYDPIITNFVIELDEVNFVKDVSGCSITKWKSDIERPSSSALKTRWEGICERLIKMSSKTGIKNVNVSLFPVGYHKSVKEIIA